MRPGHGLPSGEEEANVPGNCCYGLAKFLSLKIAVPHQEDLWQALGSDLKNARSIRHNYTWGIIGIATSNAY